MLQKLRDQTQSLFFKIIVGVLVFVLAVFGFGAFNLFTTGEPQIASVNGEPITQNELAIEAERERLRRLAGMGENFDPQAIDPARLQAEVLEQLISRELLTQAADDINVGISAARVSEVIVSRPDFMVEGQFNEDLYRNTLQMLRYTPGEFMNQTRLLLSLDQLQRALVSTAVIADWELRLYNQVINQQRDLAYLAFTRADFSDQIEISDEQIDLHYRENGLLYMTEEAVDVQYVELSIDDLLNDPQIEILEEDLLAAFEELTRNAGQDEQRSSSHILLRVEDDENIDDVVAEVVAIKARIEAGEAFDELARTLSEDPGSAQSGGEIGTFGRGNFDPTFEDALFALEPGALSDPVVTEFGVHLIRLDGIELTDPPVFEDVREELETTARREAAQVLFSQRVDEIDALAFEDSTSLDQLSHEFGLEIKRAEGITRQAGPGLFVHSGLRGVVFDTDVLTNSMNTEAFRMDDQQIVVARVEATHPAASIPLQDVREGIRETLLAEDADVLISEALANSLERLYGGESVSAIADTYGLSWQTFELARRTAVDLPRSVSLTAFELPRPAPGDKSVGEAALPEGGRAIVTVTRIVDGDMSTIADSELEGLNRFLENHRARMDFAAAYEGLEKDASIVR